MGKKRSATVHTVDGEELTFTSVSLDYCCGNSNGSLVSICGEEFDIIETPSVVSELLDELED
jgi:hypothetical protein